MSHKLTDEQIDALCKPGRASRWNGDGRQYDRDTARIIESACTAPLLARIEALEAERTRLRAAVVTARDGYISERATSKPVLESWRERTLEMLDRALEDNTERSAQS